MAHAWLEHHAGELCRIFLGWKLREDYDALLALEEGALSIDLLSGECSCDGEPLPALFIAGELKAALLQALEREGIAPAEIREARLEALFARRTETRRGREVPTLRLGCRTRIVTASGAHEAGAGTFL